MTRVLLVLVVALGMGVGLVGVVLPFLPGTALILAAGVAYGFGVGFDTVAWVALTAMALLFVAGAVAKYALPSRAGLASGMTRTSLLLAVAGGLVGFFVIPVVGVIIGALLGVLAGEYRRLGEWAPAWTATKRVLGGFGLGILAEFTAGILMVLCWVAWLVIG